MSDQFTEIIREFLAREVPEIATGDVKIKAMSRCVGNRSKVALQAQNESLDPVAACVGIRGIRIKRVINALQGEPIDLIRWHEDAKTLIARALQPAEIEAVVVDEQQRRATVFVAPNELSLAEGPRGINAELASALTGYKIVLETT